MVSIQSSEENRIFQSLLQWILDPGQLILMKNIPLQKILAFVILSVILKESYSQCQTNYAKAYADATNSYYAGVYQNIYSPLPPSQPPVCSPGVKCNYPTLQYYPYYYPTPPNYGYPYPTNTNNNNNNNNCQKCQCQCQKGQKCDKCNKCEKCSTKSQGTGSSPSQITITKSQNQIKNQDKQMYPSTSSQQSTQFTQKSLKQIKQSNFQAKKLSIPSAPIDLGVFSKQQFQKQHQSNINKSKHSMESHSYNKGVDKTTVNKNTQLTRTSTNNPTLTTNSQKNHYKDFDSDFDSIKNKFDSSQQGKMFPEKEIKQFKFGQESSDFKSSQKSDIKEWKYSQPKLQKSKQYLVEPKCSSFKESEKGLLQKTSNFEKFSLSSSSSSSSSGSTTNTSNSQKSSNLQIKSNKSLNSSKSLNAQKPKPQPQFSPLFNEQSFSQQNIKRAHDNTVKGRFNYVMGTSNNVLGDSNIIRHVVKGPDIKI